MVRILVLSFLFKGESISFVRGLWFLDLDNRKTFLVDISWISFASGVLRWWLESLLLPSIQKICVRSISFFSGSLSCLQEGDFNYAFLQGGLNSLVLVSSYIRGFSLASLWSMIASCYFSVDLAFLSWYDKYDIVDVCVCRREGAVVTWSRTLGLELTQVFSHWSG